MSLSAREQQALDSIEDGLAGSDPQLASLLATFTRLTSGEQMPVREKIRLGRPRATRRLLCNKRRRCLNTLCWHAPRTGQRLAWQRAMLVLWLIVSIALVAVALSVSRGSGKGTCTVVAVCAGLAPAHAAPSVPADNWRPTSIAHLK